MEVETYRALHKVSVALHSQAGVVKVEVSAEEGELSGRALGLVTCEGDPLCRLLCMTHNRF